MTLLYICGVELEWNIVGCRMKKMIFGDDVTIKFYQYRGEEQSVIVRNWRDYIQGRDVRSLDKSQQHMLGMDMSTKYSFVWWL